MVHPLQANSKMESELKILKSSMLTPTLVKRIRIFKTTKRFAVAVFFWFSAEAKHESRSVDPDQHFENQAQNG